MLPKTLSDQQYEECLLKIQEALIKALDKVIDLQVEKGFLSTEVDNVLDWEDYDYDYPEAGNDEHRLRWV